jgi:hypothetical protein
VDGEIGTAFHMRALSQSRVSTAWQSAPYTGCDGLLGFAEWRGGPLAGDLDPTRATPAAANAMGRAGAFSLLHFLVMWLSLQEGPHRPG